MAHNPFFPLYGKVVEPRSVVVFGEEACYRK